jgi:hypothetical protein
MASLPIVPVTTENLTIPERVELILDLTRRVELLDELLRTAREVRGAMHGDGSYPNETEAASVV